MTLPTCIIQSRRNGKFYNVDTDTGDIDFQNGGYMTKTNLEIYYELIDKNDRFWVYKRVPPKTWSQKIGQLLQKTFS